MRAFACTAAFWAAALLAGLHAQPAAAAEITRSEMRAARAGDTPARVIVYAFEAARMRVQVLPSTALRGRDRRRGAGISVSAAAEQPALRKLMRNELLLINGGFSGSSTDRPAGLLIADGRAVTLPNYAMQRADPGNACAALRKDRLRLSALLCVRADRTLSIGPMNEDALARCSQALQAGPVLLDGDGKPEVCRTDNERAYVRTVLCRRDKTVFVVLTLQPMTLHDLAVWLAAPPARNGLGCRSAINLSGDTSSGALYTRGAARPAPLIDGPASFPQASFVLVTPRSAPGWRDE
jgi:hypothetical protein